MRTATGRNRPGMFEEVTLPMSNVKVTPVSGRGNTMTYKTPTGQTFTTSKGCPTGIEYSAIHQGAVPPASLTDILSAPLHSPSATGRDGTRSAATHTPQAPIANRGGKHGAR